MKENTALEHTVPEWPSICGLLRKNELLAVANEEIAVLRAAQVEVRASAVSLHTVVTDRESPCEFTLRAPLISSPQSRYCSLEDHVF